MVAMKRPGQRSHIANLPRGGYTSWPHMTDNARIHETRYAPNAGVIGTPTSSSAPVEKRAGGDAGVPEWRSRGYLPHRDRASLIQAVTFRLADRER